MTNLPHPYEKAARVYCGLQDLDPELRIPYPHPLGIDVPYFRPQWELIADDLVAFSAKLVALREAARPDPQAQ